MRSPKFDRTKFTKRVTQLAYLMRHPVRHWRCAGLLTTGAVRSDRMASFRYLGDYLALSMPTAVRRAALMDHHRDMPQFLRDGVKQGPQGGIILWERPVERGAPPLRITLEQSSLAPMEGELQLRFTFRSDLYFLTFLIGRGGTFGTGSGRLLFIGGLQGAFASRGEMREAAKLNGEISPAAMLLLAVRAVATILAVDDVIAVAEEDQVAMGYAPDRIRLDYGRFWSDAGGVRDGQFYQLPLVVEDKPLAETPISHRARTRRKRAAKREIRDDIEQRMTELMFAGSQVDRAILAPLNPVREAVLAMA